jgi:hypothetical protein
MTPGRDQTGSATVTVTVSDDTASTTATFTATVTPVNDAPIVQPLGILTPRNRTVNAVLVASDPDNDPLTFTVSTPPANGTVDHPSQNAGAFSYTPNPGYFGPDRIEFAVRDQAAVTTGVVTVTVMRPPEIAIVADQTLEEDTTLGGLAVTVSDLETPADQLVLTATSGDLELLPAEGLALSGSGTSRALAITPAPNRFGSTRVTLLVNDGGDETPTTFMVTVLPVNDRPVAAVSQFDGVEDTQLEARLLATDVDLDALTFAIVEAPAKGTVELVDPLAGRFIYRPTQNANGQDSFTFTVTDGALVSEPAVALIQVAPVNDAPVAGRIVTVENTTVFGSLPASDIDGDVLTYSIVTQGTLGTATIVDAAAGRFSYTPNANAVGTDTLVFRVSDGTAMSDASIVIEIVPKGGGGAGGAQEGYIMPARDRTPAPPSTRRPQSHEASGRIIGS